jgi:hypothetical protein
MEIWIFTIFYFCRWDLLKIHIKWDYFKFEQFINIEMQFFYHNQRIINMHKISWDKV